MGIANKTFEPEEKKVCITLAHKVINFYFIANNIARAGQPPMEFNCCIEEPVASFSFNSKVDAQV